MNRKTTIGLFVFIIAILGGGLGLAFATRPLHCETGSGIVHTVTIKDSKPSNGDVRANACDTLTITNQDAVTRHIAFGQHDKHVVYDGISEKHLKQGESLSVVLDKVGTFHWHDHDQDEVEGYFTVVR